MAEGDARMRFARVFVALGLGALLVVVFVADVALPPTYGVPQFYVFVVILASVTRARWAVVATAAAALVFVALDLAVHPPADSGIESTALTFGTLGTAALIALTATVAYVAITVDAQRRRLRETLATTQARRTEHLSRLESVSHFTTMGTWSYDFTRPGRVQWSDEAAAIHGRPAGYQPTLAECVGDYVDKDAQKLARLLEAPTDADVPFTEELTLVSADGTERTVLVIADAVRAHDGSIESLVGVVQDLTRWHNAERTAAERTRWFSQLVSSLPFIVWTATIDGGIDSFNAALTELTGGTAETLLGGGWIDYVHLDDVADVTQRWNTAQRIGHHYEATYRLRSRDGAYLWHQVEAKPERDADGTIVRWWGTAVDVDPLYKARERARNDSAEREAILETIGDGVVVVDHEWHITYANSIALGESLLPGESTAATTIWEGLPTLIGTEVERRLRTAMATRERDSFPYFSRERQRWFDLSVVPSGTGLTAAFRDVTPLRDMSRQLDRAQRLESVGRLTGGIAHDFNNLLTAVLGGAEVLATAPSLDPKLHEMAILVHRAALRGAELTRRLVTFAGGQELEPQPTSVIRLVSSIEPMISRTIGKLITVDVDIPEGLPPIQVDPGRLEGALLNLAINARDAMPHGGTLTIRAQAVGADTVIADAMHTAETGDFVEISVSDTGTGIAQDHLAQLFDPFFTTKDSTKGSGLGLSMVWGFAHQSDGHVTVESALGSGSTFRLYLPLSGAEAATAQEPTAQEESAPTGGSAHILFVDDDELVRAFAVAQLRDRGYVVTEARSGVDAIALLDGIVPIDLLLTDVAMPDGVNGKELAREVLRRWPGTPVLYVSGHTEDMGLGGSLIDEGAPLLKKPFSTPDLLGKIQGMLTTSTGARQ